MIILNKFLLVIFCLALIMFSCKGHENSNSDGKEGQNANNPEDKDSEPVKIGDFLVQCNLKEKSDVIFKDLTICKTNDDCHLTGCFQGLCGFAYNKKHDLGKITEQLRKMKCSREICMAMDCTSQSVANCVKGFCTNEVKQ